MIAYFRSIIILAIIFCSIIFAQPDSLFLVPTGSEWLLNLPETSAGAQLNNSMATDGESNFAYSCYLPEYNKVYFLLKDIDGNIITEKLYAVNTDMTAVPSVKMNDSGNGILLITETNSYNSKVTVYQFHKSGYIDPIPEEMPFNLNGPGLVGADISNENIIAFSWLKKTGGTRKDSIFTQFYDHDLNAITEIKIVSGLADQENHLELKHEFREDGSSMIFLILGFTNIPGVSADKTLVFFREIDSNYNFNSGFNHKNFNSDYGGGDITVGAPGEYYFASTIYDYIFEIYNLRIDRFNISNQRLSRETITGVNIFGVSLEYKNSLVYVQYMQNIDSYHRQNSTLRVFDRALVPKWSRYPSFPELYGLKQTLLTASSSGNVFAAVIFDPLYMGIEKPRFEYCVKRGISFEEHQHPHPRLARANQFIGSVSVSNNGNKGIMLTDRLFEETIPKLILHNYQSTQSPEIVNIDLDKIYLYNDKLSLSYNHNDRFIGGLYNKGYSTGIFSYDRITDNLKYRSILAGNLFDLKLIPSGGSTYTVLFVSDRNGWDLSSTISFAKYDAYATPIGPIIEVENSLADSAHFSDHPVWDVNQEDSLLMAWSFTDYYHEKQKIMFRWFTKNFELLDSTLYELDYFTQKFIKPLTIYFDNTGKAQLLVKLTDDWVSWEGELQKWEIGFNGNGFDLMNISQIDGFSNDKITGIKPIDDNNYMFTLTDLDNEKKSLIVYNKSGEIASEKYSISELVEQPVVKNIAYTFFENEMTLYFEGMYEQDGIESQVVYEQKIVIENSALSVENTNIIVSEFNVHFNYPNPFNPSTNISFTIPEAGNVKIEVFNSLGQLVELLKNDLYIAGEHTISFNAQHFGSGVYFYKISYNNKTKTGKMLLLK